ncbi:MAG: hypothetical protein M4579_006341 [Chaenotheca gracillima]|nr:MAG: hypothetical protein M4579_006341 [Chaenotheca gracillima]
MGDNKRLEFRTTRPLKHILREAHDAYLQRFVGFVRIFHPDLALAVFWREGETRQPRSIQSVKYNPQRKEDLLRSFRSFLSPTTAEYYSRLGETHKMGYLFYGPPGTGKSSMIVALASEFKLNIYLCNLKNQNLTEQSLGILVGELPSNALLVFEEFDCLFDKTRKGGISPVTLLELMDGIATKTGQILILTTNNRDKIEARFLRSGRVNDQLEFKLSSRQEAAEIFLDIFSIEAKMRGEEQWAKPMAEGRRQAEKDAPDLRRLADGFSHTFPERTISHADITIYLLGRRGDPQGALRDAYSWVDANRKDKV